MAAGTNAGWTNPYQAGMDPTTGKALQTLTTFLNDPTFPGGATVGGTLALTSGTVGGNQIVAGLSTHPLLIQGANTSFSTDSSGNATITFPTAFPTAIISVTATPSTGGGGFGQVVVTSSTAAHFVVNCHSNTGSTMASSSLAVYWIAIGY